MHEASVAISHLEYEPARRSISGAESSLSRMQDIINSRAAVSGTVSCESNTFSSSNDHFSSKIFKNISTAYPYMNVVILLAALLGVGFGCYVASTNFYSNKRN